MTISQQIKKVLNMSNDQPRYYWIGNLTIAAKLLFDADEKKLENLIKFLNAKDYKWGRYVESLKNKVTLNKTSIITELKKLDSHTDSDLYDVDFKLSLLIGLCSNFEAQTNEDKLIHSDFKTNKLNIALAAVLIAYIQSEKYQGKKPLTDFAERFINLTNLLTTAERVSPQPNTNIKIHQDSPPPLQPQKMTLILVFGQSKWDLVNEISNKNNFDDEFYVRLMEEPYEWFWYGANSNKPKDILIDEQGNMCWLQVDIESNTLPNQFEVKNTLHVRNLIKTIKKQPTIRIQTKALGLFQLATSRLGERFIRA